MASASCIVLHNLSAWRQFVNPQNQHCMAVAGGDSRRTSMMGLSMASFMQPTNNKNCLFRLCLCC